MWLPFLVGGVVVPNASGGPDTCLCIGDTDSGYVPYDMRVLMSVEAQRTAVDEDLMRSGMSSTHHETLGT